MDNDVLDIFTEARSRFNIVGIIGMDSSGKTEFFDIIRKEHLMAVTQLEQATQLMIKMYKEDNNPDVIRMCASYGLNVLDAEGNAVSDMALRDKVWDLTVNDLNFSKDVYDLAFPSLMELLAQRLKILIDMLPGTLKEYNIPIFIELPLATGVNYKDYVDTLVSVIRPKTYDNEEWYLKAKLSEDGIRYLYRFSPYFENLKDCRNFLKQRDRVWGLINKSADIVVTNDSTYEIFLQRSFECISNIKKQITVNI